MRKILCCVFFLVLITQLHGQVELSEIKPFDVDNDSLQSILIKIDNYDYTCMVEKHVEDILHDIIIENYRYFDMIGTLELFCGNNKLYYIRFTCNNTFVCYWSQSEYWYNFYLKYWD